jgi:hypothetical protein
VDVAAEEIDLLAQFGEFLAERGEFGGGVHGRERSQPTPRSQASRARASPKPLHADAGVIGLQVGLRFNQKKTDRVE